MKKALLSFSFLLIIGGLFTAFTLEDKLEALLAKLEKYRTEYPQEKIHLHFDKPYYTIGEDIWFKAYVVLAENNKLSGLSKIVYVDLINESGTVEKSLRLPVTAGTSRGDFKLTDSLSEGNYRVRAYTNWMRNFDEDFFFTKNIRIVNAFSNDVIGGADYTFSKNGNHEVITAELTYTDVKGHPLANKEVSYNVQLNLRDVAKGKGITDREGRLRVKFTNPQPFVLKSGKVTTTVALNDEDKLVKTFLIKAASQEASLQFFPEGGELVNSLRSVTGFKAVSADGRGISVSGRVTDQNKTTVAEFKSDYAGMGRFLLNPQSGKNYTAVVKFADGSEKEVPLPKAFDEGYVLHIENSLPDTVKIRISVTKNLLNQGEITLIAQSGGKVHYVSKSPARSPVFTASVPKSRFPSGIVQFTLFSPDFRPVAERLIFIQNNDALKINISSDKPVSKPREKVRMRVNVSDAEGKPVHGSFSLAVINESKVPDEGINETTIFSNLLLTSDLKGFVETPQYYFINASSEKIKQLDNLMLTQGWRRFVWKDILSDNFPSIVYQPEKSIQISGRVTTPSGKPVAGGSVLLMSTGGSGLLLDTLTNEDGRFSFDNLVFNDSTKFVVQARNAKDRKNVEIELDQNPPPLVSLNKNEPAVEVNLSPSLLRYLQNSKEQFDELRKYGLGRKTILLDEVKVIEKKPAVKNSSNLNGAGNADAVIKGELLENFSDLATALQGRVAGLIIMNGIPYLTRSMGTPMQLIVDGIYMEPDYLSMINPMDVESIEVLKNIGYTAVYGMRGGGGVLIINTKRGEPNYSYNRYAPGIVTYSPLGYYIGREFYSPDYDDPETDKQKPDLRITVYWQPDIITDKNGTAFIEFFNSDVRGTYKALIEGVGVNGSIGRQVYRYTVK